MREEKGIAPGKGPPPPPPKFGAIPVENAGKQSKFQTKQSRVEKWGIKIEDNEKKGVNQK